jgi:hypothetical protein
MKPLRDSPLLRLLAGAVLLGGCDGSTATGARPVVRPALHAAAHAAPHASLQMAPPEPATDAVRAGAAVTNVFAATSWQAAPAPPPSVVAPPVALVPAAPVAPPLPFRYIGSYGDGGTQIVMLVKGDQLYLVAVGDTIDNAYRIERVSGTIVELTYLPLKLTQSLSTGGAG